METSRIFARQYPLVSRTAVKTRRRASNKNLGGRSESRDSLTRHIYINDRPSWSGFEARAYKNVHIPPDYRQSLRHGLSIVICGAPRRASSSWTTIKRRARSLRAPREDAGEGRRGTAATRELETAGCYQVSALQRFALSGLAEIQGQQLRRGGGVAG